MEESAFEQIARRLREKAMTSCRCLGMDSADAEDIAQDVMLKLWSMRKDLDKYKSVDSLAALMAKHLALNAKRDRKTVANEDAFGRIATATAGPAERLETKENEEWLKRKMADLPNHEIARILGIGETSVSTLLARARRTLMEELRKRQAIITT